MEFFEDKFVPLKIRIKEQDEYDDNGNVVKAGKEHIVSTKMLTNKKIREMEALQKSKNVSASDIVAQTMVAMFDKPVEFWDNFSLDFMNKLITYATETLKKKPTENTNIDG
jgi:hypothetical protein